MKEINTNPPQLPYKYPKFTAPPNPKITPNMTHNATWNPSSFGAFFESWLVRQEHYLDELLSAESSCNQELQNLVSRVLSHYQEYFEAKAAVARNDPFLLFSPTWFSSFERSFLWIAGFKPALVFRLLGVAVEDLTEEQMGMVEVLKMGVVGGEIELEREVARVQESVAAPPLLEMARRAGKLVDGERREVADAIQELKNAMKALVERADRLRVGTTQNVVAILNPVQGVKFLASASQLQLRIRNCGALSQQPRNR